MSSEQRSTSAAGVGWDLGRVGIQRRPVRRRVVAVAGRPGDDASVGLDHLELLEPDAMELLGADVQAGEGPDASRVPLRPSRGGTQAGHLAGGRQVGAQRLQVARVGRPDVPLHCLEDPVPIGLPRDRREGHDRRSRSRPGKEPFELTHGPLGNDASSREAGRPSLVQEADHRIGDGRVRGQPGKQPLQSLWRVRLLELDELGKQRLVALLLDRPHQVHPRLVVRDLRRGGKPEELARDPLLLVQRGLRDGGGRAERLVGKGASCRASGRTRIVQAVVVALVAVDRGQCGVELERALPGALRKGGQVG